LTDNKTMALGICAGASTIGMVLLSRGAGKAEVIWARTRSHDGNARGTLASMLSEVEGLENLRIAVTGRKFRRLLALSNISEPEALEIAFRHAYPPGHPYRTVISAGGETFMVYHLDDQGLVQDIRSGNKCASGTGEFLQQQLSRMGLSMADLESLDSSAKPHQVSGRCSVFCKSDCTHALNKGVPKMAVVSGLARMMAGKCMELLKKLPKDRAVLIGGCSQNKFMVRYLREEIADLSIPEQAPWFEALGVGLWALDHDCLPYPGMDRIFQDKKTSFSTHLPLERFHDKVEFKEGVRGQARPGDRVVLGLDVGSTTTKGVLMRTSDSAILAADYLRTDGDPVGASRRVYASLGEQLKTDVEIVGLGVTGSGRAIAGLHAQTRGVINEIIAHATAAVHFDPAVDTIFEIGGQDAKYTSITNSVPSDYAMNEACSAGTGSFLEESARETLGVEMTSIGELALKGAAPPNFNDQCAAFISSDIKIATQEGLPLEDILAGLVYSICMNYANRVKGNRPMGSKVFMQGGVCYNSAVPLAMAALTGKDIVVPPDPGLMGALGVAIEVRKRMEQGLLEESRFDLAELAAREVQYLPSFRCKGGREMCDRGCEIARMRIGKKVFPFGGICNLYENLRHKRKIDQAGLDNVAMRERMVFSRYAPAPGKRERVGVTRSFLTNTYFPLYHSFFSELGLEVVLPERVDPKGIEQQASAFCYPGELAHGYMADLLAMKPDYLFLPHLRSVPGEAKSLTSYTCVLVQSEPYYLRSCFPEIDAMGDRLLSPMITFRKGMGAAEAEFVGMARQMGRSSRDGRQAFARAVGEQQLFFADLKRRGGEALRAIADNNEEFGVVLFGRPYNAFTEAANKGIPAKFASRGVRILTLDMLDLDAEELPRELHMYWGLGRMILKAAQYVARRDDLYPVYITNFSCGPDSFLLGYFREIMGRKPSLTLELDSHTADAGLETRIEAFLDIVSFSRSLSKPKAARPSRFRPAAMEQKGEQVGVRASSGEWLPLNHERVRLVFPSMNNWGTRLISRSLAAGGIKAIALPPADEEVLKIGRGNSSCKECLPLQVTVGSMIDYLESVRPKDEVSVYFMPGADGPCRFGQYHVFSRKVIERRQIPDAAVYATSSTEGYSGLGQKLTLKAWRAVVIGDLLEEMISTVKAGAADPELGMAVLEGEVEKIHDVIDKEWSVLSAQLQKSAAVLSLVKLKRPLEEIPKISLVGEIFVRHDPISRQGLVERLAKRGFIVRTSQVTEWVKYTDWLVRVGMEGSRNSSYWVRMGVKWFFDRRIRALLAPSGLFHNHVPWIRDIIKAGSPFISPDMNGEAILTVGAAFHEILNPACGIISIGPFGCMPSRLAEAVLSEKFTTDQLRLMRGSRELPFNGDGGNRKLPFLSIETDGNPFPQIIEARLEAFCLQAQRLHERLHPPRP
jgi:predicted CoA-substrate-specific enzyme activase